MVERKPSAADERLPAGAVAAATTAAKHSWPPAVATWLAEEARDIDRGALDPACKSRLYPVGTQAVRAVALMLHGFTAGPWQYDEIGPKLAAEGVLGLAVRLVGHGATKPGAAHPTEDGSDLPKAAEVSRFAVWADRALEAARALASQYRVPLRLLGASAGGAMALDILRREHANIERAALIAPLLRPKSRLLSAFVRAVGLLPRGDWLADRWQVGWPKGSAREDGWRRPGHQQFNLGNVQALFRYARAVAPKSGRALSAPLQILATDIDDKICVHACRALARSEGGRHALFSFAAADQVPHAMMTAWEHPNERTRAKVLDILFRFIVHGETTAN